MDRMAAMEAFVLVVDTGSFSAAARRLNVGQPAVSKLVAQLEEKLGVKLLVRTTRGLTATEAGLHYYERARRSIQEADEAELVARGAGRSLTGRLRIAAAVTFARIHVMPHLPEFLQQHPEAVTTFLEVYLQAIRRLADGKIKQDEKALAIIEKWTKASPDIVRSIPDPTWPKDGKINIKSGTPIGSTSVSISKRCDGTT